MADVAAVDTRHYGGFWRRFAALIIDTIIFYAVLWVLGRFLPIFENQSASLTATGIGVNVDAELSPFGTILAIVLSWLYFAILESSARGATVGKMALGLRVIDVSGGRLSFLQATGRFFGKFVSGAILAIGYIMAAFTARKQALHDIMAGTLVVRTN
jgi:uncharacterized RDD family membrane protein YckC